MKLKPGQIIVGGNLLLLLILEAQVLWPQLFYGLIVAANLLLLVLFYLLLRQPGKSWWSLWLLPFLVFNSINAYILLIPQEVWLNKIFIQALFVLFLGFNFSYCKQAYDFVFHPEQENNLPNLAANFSFLSWFFALAAVYGLQLFLDLSYWILLVILIVLAIGTTYLNLWINRLLGRERIIFMFLAAFIVAQLAWAVYFLPFDYNSLGLIIALVYYVVWNLIRFYLSHNWNKKNLRSLLVFAGLIMALVLLTVKWR
jgi:hypothetical protein